MDFKQVIDFWGESNMIRWPQNSISNIEISNPAKEFLVNVGLPNSIDWTITIDTSLKRVQKFPDYPNLCIIGYDTVMPICLDEVHYGHVLIVEENNNRIRFVNSSVEFFGFFLMIYQEYRFKVNSLDDEEEIMDIIDSVENRMIQLDKPAMTGEENYWPVIIEQMQNGFL